MNASHVDWSKPVLMFDELLCLMGYQKETLQKWCRKHREFCQPVGNGEFLIHRDRFVEWVASGEK